MANEFIILLVGVVGALVLGIVLFINRSIEREKEHKAIQIGTLSETAHRLQRMIDTIPDAYMHPDLKKIILSEMKTRLQKMVEIAPEQETFKKKLASAEAMLEESAKAGAQPKQEVHIQSPQQANEVRAVLQDLTRIIETFRDSGVIPPQAANVFLSHVHDSFVESNVSYLTLLGDQSKAEKKWRLAIHHYQKGMAELAKRNQNGRFNDRLASLKAMCAEMSKRADEEAGTVQRSDEPSELTKGLSDLTSEEDAWKKKYF